MRLQVLQLFNLLLVGLHRILRANVERMFPSSEESVHYDPYGPNIHALCVLLEEDYLRGHVNKSAAVLVHAAALGLVFGAQPEVDYLNRS